jgi:hypothetical protein
MCVIVSESPINPIINLKSRLYAQSMHVTMYTRINHFYVYSYVVLQDTLLYLLTGDMCSL